VDGVGRRAYVVGNITLDLDRCRYDMCATLPPVAFKSASILTMDDSAGVKHTIFRFDFLLDVSKRKIWSYSLLRGY
jgi:hypothetical protein